MLATCGGDNLIKIWDPTTGKEMARFKEFPKAVTCLEFNMEGTLICAGSVDKTVRVIDLKTQRARHTFTGHTDTVNALTVMIRVPQIVSGGGDRTLKLWDYEKEQLMANVRAIYDNIKSRLIIRRPHIPWTWRRMTTCW